ncbi:hypothetical protein ACLOJK_012729 [Asimina triloba]
MQPTWQPSALPATLVGRTSIQEEEQSPKKSVLDKMKEKAKKLRSTLSKKKGNDDWPATYVAIDDLNEETEADPEYHGAPMYESELAPEDCKVAAMQNQKAPPVLAERHVLEPRVIQNQQQESPQSENRGIAETVTEMLAPAYAMVSEATLVIKSKIQGSAPTAAAAAPATTGSQMNREQKSDVGVSVKAYLKQKLEPGEDDRELSRVISEVMSPKKMGRESEMGMVDKVKGAVSSFLRSEEESSSEAKIPVSTNPYEVEPEETHGRRLQAN